jgi:adenylosuccinate synthase
LTQSKFVQGYKYQGKDLKSYLLIIKHLSKSNVNILKWPSWNPIPKNITQYEELPFEMKQYISSLSNILASEFA